MKKMKRFLGIMLAMVIAVTMLAGCGGSSKESNSSDNGKTLKFGCFSYSESLDPANIINSAWCNSRYGIGECLFKYKDDLSVENTICDEYSTEDNKTWVFHICDGVKFSNGNDVTPSAIKACWDVLYANKTGSSNPSKFMDYESITPDDDARTLTIVLKQAKADLRKDLAYPVFVILDVSGDYDLAENPIGTGPYALTSFDSKTKATLVKNEYYWQEGKPYIDELVYKVVDDDNQALNQLLAGEIDGIEDLSLSNASNVDGNADTKTATSFSYNVEELFFNTLDEHFSDEHVRRALAMAIDRESLTKALTFGYAEIANTVLPRALLYQTNDTVNALSYDIDAAKEELAQSAYPDGFDTTISIASGNNTRLQEAQIIQAAGAQIGINIEINAQEISTFRSDFRDLNFSMMINSATADYPDANSIFAFQVDPDGWSKCYWTSYNNETAADLMRKGQVTPDGDERAAVYEELQQILADEVPYIPLYNSENVVGLRDNVEGFTVLPNGSVHFEDVYFEE